MMGKDYAPQYLKDAGWRIERAAAGGWQAYENEKKWPSRWSTLRNSIQIINEVLALRNYWA